jgi:transketolase
MDNIAQLAKVLRYYSLVSTTEAGSGHPTSSLSAADLMAVLFFDGFFKYDIHDIANSNNDRLIFSKGHASPLFFALWAAAGATPYSELMTLRKFKSRLEGHPTRKFPYTEANTGSLGQGLSIGAGIALNALYVNKSDHKTYVLLGDSEMAEGSNWEAAAFASYYKLTNLIAILDVNRLGQTGETMYGWNTEIYENRFKSFGWETMVIDGHDLSQIHAAYESALNSSKPFAIIAKTVKGKGIKMLEDKLNWHGKALKKDELEIALKDLGSVNTELTGQLVLPDQKPEINKADSSLTPQATSYPLQEKIATRKAYGNALVNLGKAFSNLLVLDGETQNSTFSETFENKFPERFFQMFIAEQNMVGVATGLARGGNIPFVSTFTAFFTRAFDQIRMSQYCEVPIKYIGSHGGVSIGEDGSSQMGLEDIAMFSSLLESVVLYPSDAVSTEKLLFKAYSHPGIVYMRTTRMDTPVLYGANEEFEIGKSKTLKNSPNDKVIIIGAGVTLHEALKAYEELKKENIYIRIVDLYSIKPLDIEMLQKSAKETKAIITVEDHYPSGGIGSAVSMALSESGIQIPLHMMCVRKIPMSGKPEELLDYEEISASSIILKVKQIVK